MVEEMREERSRISRGFAELDRREEEDDEEGFFEADDEVCGGFGEASIAKETLVLMKQV